jgi:hypothetical protein
LGMSVVPISSESIALRFALRFSPRLVPLTVSANFEDRITHFTAGHAKAR